MLILVLKDGLPQCRTREDVLFLSKFPSISIEPIHNRFREPLWSAGVGPQVHRRLDEFALHHHEVVPIRSTVRVAAAEHMPVTGRNVAAVASAGAIIALAGGALFALTMRRAPRE